MYTEPGISSSRSRSSDLTLNMEGPSSLMHTVKLGENGKEKALLVRKGAGRWLCALATLLVLGVCGAFLVHDHLMERKGKAGRLSRLVRSTGERLQTLRRVSDRLKGGNSTAEIKAQIARELKLGREVHRAEEEHALAQAGMMKQGLEPSDKQVLAAEGAALTVPKDVQRAMLTEFNMKGSFLLWATSANVEAVWRMSKNFSKPPSAEVEKEMKDMEYLYDDGLVRTHEVIAWLRGNISAGIYPPPVNVLGGVAGYIEELCDFTAQSLARVGLFLEFDTSKRAYHRKKVAGEAEAEQVAEDTIKRLLALAADEMAWHMDPTPTFKKIYATLLQFELTKWLFVSDDPDLDDGYGDKFYKYRKISESSDADDDEDEDGDDGEDSYAD